MPRALQPVSGILPAPASPVSHLSQRSCRGKRTTVAEQLPVVSPLPSSTRSKKRREPPALGVRTQDSDVEVEDKTPQRKAPDTKKRRNSVTRLQSVSTRCDDGHTRSGASEEENASVASPSLPSSLSSSLTKRTHGRTHGSEADLEDQSGQPSPACGRKESQEIDTELTEAPPRRVTRQMLKEDSSNKKPTGGRRSTGEETETVQAEPSGRTARKSTGGEQGKQREADVQKETHASAEKLASVDRCENGRGKGKDVGEKETEMTSPPKRRETSHSSGEQEEETEDLEGVSEVESDTEEDVELHDLENEIEKFESALTILRPTVGDYAGEREESVQAISSHIDKLLARKRGGMIYLCGASGTGKTCTALHVLDQKLKEAKHRGKVHKELVTISCAHREKDAQLFCEMLVRMLPPSSRPNERALYSDLKAALMKEGIGGLVTRFTNFTKKFDKLWLCLVDEVDFLATSGKIRADVRDGAGRAAGGSAGGRGYGGTGAGAQRSSVQQDIVMALALAATHPQSKIVVVAISNSAELAQHFTGLPVPSLTFCPYTERQLTNLLLKRLDVLGGRKCFAAPAILVFARKAANTYGDFRMALSGFCRAIEDKLGSLHNERARALLAAASRSRPRSSVCSTRAPPSRSMTGEASVDSPDVSCVQDSTVSPTCRKSEVKALPTCDAEVAPLSHASTLDESGKAEMDPSPSASPAWSKAKRRASSALFGQAIPLPSRREEERESGAQQTPTPSFSDLLNRSVRTGDTPQHLHQTSPSTAASTSSLPSCVTSASSHSPGAFSKTAGGSHRKTEILQKCVDDELDEATTEDLASARLRKATQKGNDVDQNTVDEDGTEEEGAHTDIDGSGSSAWKDVASPHSGLRSPLLHASSVDIGELSRAVCTSSTLPNGQEAMGGERGEKRAGESYDLREDGLEMDAEQKGRGRHRQSCGRRRESVRVDKRVSDMCLKTQESKSSRESRVGSQSHIACLSPSVRQIGSGVEAHLVHSTSQPPTLASCPAASFFSQSPPSPLSLSSFSSATTSTPPPSPFPAGSGSQARGAQCQGSGQRRRLGTQLSALKLLQLQQEPTGNSVEQTQTHRRPSSCSSGCSPTRSLGLRDIQNLKNGSSKSSPLNHLITSSRASHSPLSSREPSRSGDGRGVLRNSSESGDSSRTGRDGGGDSKSGTGHAGEGEYGRYGSQRSGEVSSAVREGRSSVSQMIGVGEMNARAGAVFGNDQQNVVARIQGLPLMHQVYLLAACRSALKRVHEANASGGALSGGVSDRERGTEGGIRGGRHSQQENVSSQQREQLLGCGGSVDITFTDVEVQYRQLCQELQNGYLLSQHMATSCWRHALEAFEQMGLMRPKRPGILSSATNNVSGVSGSTLGSSLSSPMKGRLWGGAGSARSGFGAFGPFGGGARRSSGGLFVGMGAGGAGHGGGFKTKLAAEREQAWELQLSPALIEAAIKRLQPILMSSDLEEHFTRGLEA